DETRKYENNGHFFFNPGDTLSKASAEVPNEAGVFIIYRLARGSIDLVYIEQSGFGSSLLNDQINTYQEYFDQKMSAEGIEVLDIYWYVTYNQNHQDVPDYVKGLLMQRYYEIYGDMPPWNGEF